MKKKTTLLIVLALTIIGISTILIYREYAPEDQKATGNTYYLSPTGNDVTGNGSNSSPWKGINKANSVVQAGDTVIFKDGIYNMYDPVAKTIILSTITKSGTIWKAENKHKAVIDGGMGPELFAANPQNAGAIYRAKMPYVKPDEFWINMVLVSGASNITIDGLVFANSPGRGLTIYQGSSDKTIENITVKNVWFDFNWENPFLIQSVSKADYSKVKNITFENGLNTRAARQMLCKIYDGVFCTNWPGVHRPSGSSNIVTKNSVFAYNYGEIGPDHGATYDLFENNVVIHSFISYYFDTVQNITVRNNLMVASDSLRTNSVPGLFGQPSGPSSTRETHIQGVPDSFANKNIHIYNNVLVGLNISLFGGFKGAFYPTEGTYIGHNTIIGTDQTRSWSSLTGNFIDQAGYSDQNPIRGIVENNLFITEQMNSKSNVVRIDPSGWEMVGRNNLVPQSQASSLLHTADAIKSDVSGVVNPQAVFNLSTPSMFVHRDAFKIKVEQDVAYSREYVKNLHLKSTSLAVNAGSTAGADKGVTPPSGARTKDYYGNPRTGVPDIGAIEFGGGQTTITVTQTPIATNTVVPTSTITIVPSGTVQPTSTIQPTVGGGVVCGRADVNQDGKFSIVDFIEFAKMYGKTCNDKDINYGVCGHKDTDRNGTIEIRDFVSFAGRYTPRASCVLN